MKKMQLVKDIEGKMQLEHLIVLQLIIKLIKIKQLQLERGIL